MFFPSNNPLTKQLDVEIQDLLLDRQARNFSPKTVHYYRQTLTAWRDFLRAQSVTKTEVVTAVHVQRYLVQLAEQGRTAGGVVEGVDANTGQVIVRSGKECQARAIFIEAKTGCALLAYYRHRECLADDFGLWVKPVMNGRWRWLEVDKLRRSVQRSKSSYNWLTERAELDTHGPSVD